MICERCGKYTTEWRLVHTSDGRRRYLCLDCWKKENLKAAERPAAAERDA